MVTVKKCTAASGSQSRIVQFPTGCCTITLQQPLLIFVYCVRNMSRTSAEPDLGCQCRQSRHSTSYEFFQLEFPQQISRLIEITSNFFVLHNLQKKCSPYVVQCVNCRYQQSLDGSGEECCIYTEIGTFLLYSNGRTPGQQLGDPC